MNRTISPPTKIKNKVKENHAVGSLIHNMRQTKRVWEIIKIIIITGWCAYTKVVDRKIEASAVNFISGGSLNKILALEVRDVYFVLLEVFIIS